MPPVVLWRLRASVAAGTGDRAVAEEALGRIDETDPGTGFWQHLEIRRMAGQAALFDGDAETAAVRLARVMADAASAD
jgi:hypothetical protein